MSTENDDIELISLLQRCEVGMSLKERVEICQELLTLINNGRIRDVDRLPIETYKFVTDSICVGWEHREAELRDTTQAVFIGIIDIPEFETDVAREFVDNGFLLELCGRFQAGLVEEKVFLRDTLHWAYSSFPEKRTLLRQQMGSSLEHFVRSPNRKFHVAEMLQVLREIIKGFPMNLTEVHRSLLTRVVLPLHEPNQMAVWSIQQPLIESYHEPLVGCLVAFLKHQPDLIEVIFEAIVAAWPEGFNSNTAKEVLLLHELQTLMNSVPPDASNVRLDIMVLKVIECLRVDNSRVVERAMFIFKDETFMDMIAKNSRSLYLPVLSALLRGAEPFWNPTVNKSVTHAVDRSYRASVSIVQMTYHVLESLEKRDTTAFIYSCESLLGDGVLPAQRGDKDAPTPTASREALPFQPGDSHGGLPPPTSLKGAMGSWRPSTGRRDQIAGAGATMHNPPAAVTGVAPWALKSPTSPRRSSYGFQRTPAKQSPAHSTKRVRRSGTDDGHEGEVSGLGKRDKEQSTFGALGDRVGSSAAQESTASCEPNSSSSGGGDGQGPGLRRAREFMAKIRPKEVDKSSGPSWQELQLEPTPTLLPKMRFHDLVFGHELGQGSFSVVKYARHITRGKSRSEWPEFAVKVISTTKIQWHSRSNTIAGAGPGRDFWTFLHVCNIDLDVQFGPFARYKEELNYERSVTNEIACLRILSHPGIARLISTFRWRDGAYLVLEYASRGDLHSHVKEHGSLSEESTRFVVGEVVAALCSVHECGFVFGDLKPENVLITESGHIKITDFGACRPVTESAKDILNQSRDALRTLRDGDWRVAAGLPPNPQYSFTERRTDSDSESDVGGVGTRVDIETPEGEATQVDEEDREEEAWAEGTAAYMPPEVARGGAPGPASDAWALGCVTFLCLSGRPPIFEETDEAIMACVVRFSSSADFPRLPPATSEGPRSLIRSLMEPDAQMRLTVEQAGKHEFLVEGGVDVFTLHRTKPTELAKGTVAPAPNAAWSRRQNSMIWAPMPQEYRFDRASRELGIIEETEVERGAAFRRSFASIRESIAVATGSGDSK